jgi:ADP-ribose pyrophosphatase
MGKSMKDLGTAEVLYEGRYVRLMRVGGRWEYAQRQGRDQAVVILAVTDRGEALFVEQFRAPVRASVIEFPAGLVGDLSHHAGESLELAATRELEEETGYTAGRMEELISGPPSPGLASEIITWFRARELKQMGQGGGDHTENIIVHAVPLADAGTWLERMRREGKLVDPKVYIGLYFLSR